MEWSAEIAALEMWKGLDLDAFTAGCRKGQGMSDSDHNQTAANRPPATHELGCRKCGGSFLGDEHHQFCGECVVEVAREITEMQREAQNLIGLSKEPIEGGRPISIIKPGAEMV